MNPGELNKRVTIIKNRGNRDDYGELTDEWDNVATVWANVQLGSGREFYAAHKTNTELSGLIKIRYHKGIDSSMRVIYGKRVLEIIKPPINIEEKNRIIELHVRELDK